MIKCQQWNTLKGMNTTRERKRKINIHRLYGTKKYFNYFILKVLISVTREFIAHHVLKRYEMALLPCNTCFKLSTFLRESVQSVFYSTDRVEYSGTFVNSEKFYPL